MHETVYLHQTVYRIRYKFNGSRPDDIDSGVQLPLQWSAHAQKGRQYAARLAKKQPA